MNFLDLGKVYFVILAQTFIPFHTYSYPLPLLPRKLFVSSFRAVLRRGKDGGCFLFKTKTSKLKSCPGKLQGLDV